MIKHLNPVRRGIEVFVATFGVWLGVVVLSLLGQGGEPLYWLGVGAEAQADAAVALMAFGVLHAFGIRLNGDWRWSPLMRAAGLAGHAAALTWITVAAYYTTVYSPYGLASGFATYSYLSAALWWLAFWALMDQRRSLGVWRACNG